MPPSRTVIRRIRLKPEHRPRGHVHFFVEGKEIPRPVLLEMVKTPGDAVHLVYVDSTDGQVAESWHPTPDAALYHAKWEFGIDPEEWEELAPGAAGT